MRMWRNWSPHILVVELQRGAASLANILAVPKNVKHRVIILTSNSTSREIKT